VFKKYFVIFCLFCFLNAADFLFAEEAIPTKELKNIEELKEYAINSCNYYTEFLKQNKKHKVEKFNILMFALYYDSNEVKLDFKTMKNVENFVEGLLNCNKEILIIANGSLQEKKINTNFDEMIFLRGLNIYNIFIKNSIDKNKVHMLTCSTFLPLYAETDEMSIKGNQRVDVVMLDDSVVYHYLDCFNNK
jgi:hypothetical protein